MKCKKCKSEMIHVQSKSNDLHFLTYMGAEKEGYFPEGLEISRGDYLNFHFCPNCATIDGDFPIPQVVLEEVFMDDDV